MYKYVQKKLTPSFLCPWYLKISSGSEMFNNCYNYNNNNYSAECTCEEQKSYKDVWMHEREKYCNDGWMFLNKSPTMMCLATKKKKKKKKESSKRGQSTRTTTTVLCWTSPRLQRPGNYNNHVFATPSLVGQAAKHWSLWVGISFSQENWFCYLA